MKNYLIVEGSSGIGKELSQNLAQSGHKVWATFFNNDGVSDSENISYHPFHVLDDELNLDFLPHGLDGLAYCPGSITLKPFHRIKASEFRDDFSLQVLGAIKVIQQCLPKLKNSEMASIILFSTVAVQQGFNFHSMVSTSKGAIEGLSRALSAELAPSIRVNCIAPSLTNTPLAGKLLNSEEKIKSNGERHPLKRIGNPSDISNMAEFLLSDKSSWISGQILHVDGGISAVKQ